MEALGDCAVAPNSTIRSHLGSDQRPLDLLRFVFSAQIRGMRSGDLPLVSGKAGSDLVQCWYAAMDWIGSWHFEICVNYYSETESHLGLLYIDWLSVATLKAVMRHKILKAWPDGVK